jgi:hypothetical protein
MKSLILVALLAITSPNAFDAFDASNAQMTKDYNVARSAMLTALTPSHRQLLASIAARLATSTSPDYTDAAKQLDVVLSPAEKHAILTAVDAEHEKMRAVMQHVNTSFMHGTTVLHIGAPPLRGSETAGFVLIHTAMNLGPMTMNAMIVRS